MEFDRLQASLAAFDEKRMDVHALCAAWRAEGTLLQRLPPRYTEVLEDLLQRLESAALFSEESCSFSVQDLRASLQAWLAKARDHLGSPRAL